MHLLEFVININITLKDACFCLSRISTDQISMLIIYVDYTPLLETFLSDNRNISGQTETRRLYTHYSNTGITLEMTSLIGINITEVLPHTPHGGT